MTVAVAHNPVTESLSINPNTSPPVTGVRRDTNPTVGPRCRLIAGLARRVLHSALAEEGDVLGTGRVLARATGVPERRARRLTESRLWRLASRILDGGGSGIDWGPDA